jgi:tetratricopeptide (TPR) repeat protein
VYVAVHQLRVDAMFRVAFEDDRRDEVLWFELALPAARRATLHARLWDDREETFEALGGGLSELLQRCLCAWLEARGLPPLGALEPFDGAAFLEVCRLLAPVLAQAASAEPAAAVVPEPPGEEAGSGLRLVEGDAVDESPAAAMEEAAAPSATGFAALGVSPPAVLAVPFLRVVELCCTVAAHEEILAVDPGNPDALRSSFLARLGQGRDFPAIRRVIAAAPGWGKPYLSLRALEGDREDEEEAARTGAPTEEEELTAQGWAALCMPANEYALQNYAWSLAERARKPEALRLWERVVALDPKDLDKRLTLMDQQGKVGRLGSWWHTAMQHDRIAEATGCGSGLSAIFGSRERTRIRNELASAYLNVGRMDEAIQILFHSIHGQHDEFPGDAQELEWMQSSPELVARSYAREGHFRGDLGRVLEGFGRAEPEDSADLAMFLEALVATGRAGEAVLAWAHLGQGQHLRWPLARLAAARALLLTGRTGEAVRELLTVEQGWASHGLDVALCRAWRLAAARPMEEIEAVIEGSTRRAGRRYAALVARHVADFHPGAAGSRALARALGPRAPLAFDEAWLGGFGPDTPARGAVDALFARALAADGSEPERADRLVSAWPDSVLTNVRQEDFASTAAATAYVVAQSLARYLAATTGEPGPLCGGLRQVASESLQALGRLRDSLALADLRAILAALEPGCGLDPWLVDPWLLRLERKLGVEEGVHGRLARVTDGLPGVAALLRGPERVAAEAREAFALGKERPEGWAPRALALFERSGRASDLDFEEPWAGAAAAALSGDDRLDVLQFLAELSEHNAAPAVLAATELFEHGRSEDALEVLCERLGSGGEDWRNEVLEKLQTAWKKGRLDVPLEFKKGAGRMFEALQKGDLATAVRLGRWLRARDPDNAEVHRNLGIAQAGVGDVAGALASFCRATKEQGTQLCSGVLHQQGRVAEAMAVLDYASRWFTRAEQWLTYGGIAYAAMDNPRTVRAYANAYALDPEALDASQLNAYAGILDEVGDWVTCEKMARLEEERAGGDLLWQTCAWHNLACAHIGLGRFDEAIALAKKAVKKNPLPDNAAVFQQTLGRAQARQLPVPPEAAAAGGDAGPFAGYLDGDLSAGGDVLQSAGWPGRRAALLAARFRYDSENALLASPRAVRGAREVLGATDGTVDEEALLTRLLALETRETALFAWDDPPYLGDRWTRARFMELFRERGGIIVGEAREEDLSFEDRQVLGAGPVRTVLEYAALLRAIRGGPGAALTARGLTLPDYESLCAAWASALAADEELCRTVRKALLAADSVRASCLGPANPLSSGPP